MSRSFSRHWLYVLLFALLSGFAGMAAAGPLPQSGPLLPEKAMTLIKSQGKKLTVIGD